MQHQQMKHPQSYCLPLDVFNYFYSIDRNILKNILIRHFKKYLLKTKGTSYQQSVKKIPSHKCLTNCCIAKGLPIGNLTSQFFSNVYLNKLDQFVKHKLKCKHYIRYVDDFILLHEDKAQLQQWQIKIENFLADNLKLKLKAEKKLRPIANGTDFLGYIIKPRYKLVRKRVVNNLQQKLKSINNQLYYQPHAKFVNTPMIKDYNKPIHLKFLKQIRLYYQYLQQPYIWISEQGYLKNGLKKRILREIHTISEKDKLVLLDFNPKLRHLLQSAIASYQGHMIHVNSYNSLIKVISSYFWVYYFYQLHNFQLYQKWQPNDVRKQHDQQQYFTNTFPNHICLIQKSSHFEILNQNN